MDILRTTLKEFGFNEKEVLLYLILVKTGSNPASTLSKLADVKRSTVYLILDNLLEKGLIQQLIRNNIHFFEAINPVEVIRKLKLHQEELLKKVGKAEEEVRKMHFEDPALYLKPKALYFSHLSGIQVILEDMLRSKTKLLRAYISSSLNDKLEDEFLKLMYERIEKGIFLKMINPFRLKNPQSPEYSIAKHCERRSVAKTFEMGIDVLVYDNKIALISVKEGFGIVIESQSIHDAITKFFDYIWKFTVR